MYYNSFALTREMTERRIAKLKAELLALETYMAANTNEENKPAQPVYMQMSPVR
ncbi:hypothetical protein L0663_05155 [Dyadobacter sp. CY107]|uniref:hypothetical protein n=1 Tax=Dyadobacter fanqingshengii TaxID=2906443 RepID=UPI001F329DF5|nr:hypothetical protein [Dyadobacter fanqingshengii]MCF2502755.1 hypothetical protein [Dyadobacter fanqingshengii]